MGVCGEKRDGWGRGGLIALAVSQKCLDDQQSRRGSGEHGIRRSRASGHSERSRGRGQEVVRLSSPAAVVDSINKIYKYKYI